MKIIVSKNSVYSKLKLVGRIIKQSKEVMYNSFLFDIKNGKLTVTACDEQGQARIPIDCTIEDKENMQFLVESSMILGALKELPEQPITFEIEKQENSFAITLVYHNGKFEFTGTSADIFPKIAQQINPVDFGIDSSLLRKGLQVWKFASDDILRPIMCTINLSSKGNNIAFAASNGSYMGLYEGKSKDPIPDLDVNIPTKVSKIILDMLPVDDVKIYVSFDERNILFKINEFTIIYRLFEGRYPNYRSIIPGKSDIVVNVNRVELVSAINRVSVFSDDALSMIVLSLNSGTLELTAQSIDFNRSAKETIILDSAYQAFEIGFRSIFLIDILKTIETSICEIHLSSPNRAALFKPFEMNDYTFLLMPVMINN